MVQANAAVRDDKNMASTHDYFERMESLEKNVVEFWQLVSKASWQNFQRIYDLLDVEFDVIDAESKQFKSARQIVQKWADSGVVEKEGGCHWITRPTPQHEPDHKILLTRSNGTTMYLSRDLAAIIERAQKLVD